MLETGRLYLRKIGTQDFLPIKRILKDKDVMYAWEHPFSDEEAEDFINNILTRYDKDGVSYLAVLEKETGKLVGICGLNYEYANEEKFIGIGYIFNKKYWGNGYAFESAKRCVEYAFNIMNVEEITAQIRPENFASIKVAEKLKMKIKTRFIKIYNGKEMPHLLYCVNKTEYNGN